MKIIKVNLKGGLGNQLFQYATARSLLRRSDLLLLDPSFHKNDYLGRSFKLNNFRLCWQARNTLHYFFLNMAGPLEKITSQFDFFSFIKEDGFYVSENLRGRCSFFTVLDGYWQSYRYFDSIRAKLLNEIIPWKTPAFPSWVDLENTVAIHVRRTDYLNDARFGFIGEQYYEQSIALLNQELHEPRFIVFSDDLNWCKTFFPENYIFCEDHEWNKDWLQLYLFSKAKHQIIANSSFSWWGAWLNCFENKIVIRPACPFQEPELEYENLYPPDWIPL